MKIALYNAGKRYNTDWIFRKLNYTFQSGTTYAIIGPNGSGKSTLLQTLSGSMMFNEGSGEWVVDDQKIEPEKIYQYVSICAPYLELIEEFTLYEFLHFHQSFKPFLPGIGFEQMISEMNLSAAKHKHIHQYSSGMKQRVKLAQCIFSDTPIILLDEPCTNLDESGIALYNQLIQSYCRDRLVIVSSNDAVEYAFCQETINITDYKHL